MYLILVGHTCLGCSSFGMMEGFDVSGNAGNREHIKNQPNKILSNKYV